MEGDTIDSWKADQLDKLQERLDDGYLETDEYLWRKFEEAFKDAFTNTNEKAEAYQELTRLKQGDNLDTFITEFKRLVGLAKIDKDSHGVIELFKGGLKSGLTRAIITSQGFDPLNPWTTLDEWIKAAHAQHIKWKMSQQFNQQKDQRRQGLYKAFGLRKPANGQRRTTSQGGDAMDVDAIRTGNLTEAQKAEFMKNNQCFYCQKKGHRAKECYSKKRDAQERSNKPGSSTSQINNTSTPNMDSEEITKYLKENMGIFDEETKLSIVESLIPQDFVQSPD
jgi:Retrotransposon gag protein